MERETKKQMSIGVALSYSTIVAKFIVGLIYTPIVLKTLGQGQYGIYSLCISFLGYLTIMNAGVNAAYIRFYVQTKVQDERKLPGLNGVFLKIFVCLAFFALLMGWVVGVFSPQIFGTRISEVEYELVRRCFRFLAIDAAVQVLNCVFSSIIIANERFIFGKFVDLLISILNPLIVTPFLMKGYDCVIIIIVQMALSIGAVIVNAMFCFTRFGTSFYIKEHDIDLFKDIAQFSGFIILQCVMDQLNWQIDKFILARTQGSKEISVYSVGATFINYYITFAGALSGVFIAQINKLQAGNAKDKINDLFIRSSRVFAILIWFVMSAFVFIGKPFILRWAGTEYGESYLVGVMLMLPVTFSLTMALGQDIARAKNKHQGQILLVLPFYLFNALISIPLAIKFGAVGSALGTLLAQMITCGIIQPIYYKKALELDIGKLGRELMRISKGMMAPVLFGIIILWKQCVSPTYGSIAIYGVTYLVIYGMSMWLFGMNKDEKWYIKRAINKASSIFGKSVQK